MLLFFCQIKKIRSRSRSSNSKNAHLALVVDSLNPARSHPSNSFKVGVVGAPREGNDLARRRVSAAADKVPLSVRTPIGLTNHRRRAQVNLKAAIHYPVPIRKIPQPRANPSQVAQVRSRLIKQMDSIGTIPSSEQLLTLRIARNQSRIKIHIPRKRT